MTALAHRASLGLFYHILYMDLWFTGEEVGELQWHSKAPLFLSLVSFLCFQQQVGEFCLTKYQEAGPHETLLMCGVLGH